MFYATQDFMTWIHIELQHTSNKLESTYRTGFTYRTFKNGILNFKFIYKSHQCTLCHFGEWLYCHTEDLQFEKQIKCSLSLLNLYFPYTCMKMM